ncbi:unnamed protein product [Eruca vesicaria subsp. sativa]|uniref:Uncharacterized protein n=1 Tax=Eruca vesicaria subsp. sativa TaxID=29727 RepID=A0ABC8IQ52_ERUVS|nr:unnamed protein product [Eruca vesicaria subsp. sativa]
MKMRTTAESKEQWLAWWRATAREEIFTCDKCKRESKDIEESEVAQLLVELPTKTLRMERSFRLMCKDSPAEIRLCFEGCRSVFSRELWKCTGYVPKKFNFKYREFPCWDCIEKP